jgi:hypothetical protein
MFGLGFSHKGFRGGPALEPNGAAHHAGSAD